MSCVSETTIEIGIESGIDAGHTAALANRSFGSKQAGFTPASVTWSYGRAFGGETTLIAACAGGVKIGQAAILWHPMEIDGGTVKAAQLIDLFVDPAHRSYGTVRRIYTALRASIEGEPNCPVITTPNPKAAPLNRRFLGLSPKASLDIRVGVAMLRKPPQSVRSFWIEGGLQRGPAIALTGFLDDQHGNRVVWSRDSIIDRLSHPDRRYAVHATEQLCVITSFRRFRGMPVVLICGLLATQRARISAAERDRLISHACRSHRWPIYLYVGFNSRVAAPGRPIPARFRPSPMQLYVNDRLLDANLSRFEAIDFDFA